MNRTITLLLGIAVMLIAGCNAPSGHVDSTETSLSMEYPSVSLGPKGYFWVNIKGGNAPYKVRGIGDSSMVIAYVPPARSGTSTHVELSALGKLGTTTVTVQDSSGLTGTVTVRVESFTLFPQELVLHPLERRMVRIQGGTQPYSLVSVSDSCVRPVMDFSYMEIYARSIGSAVVTIADSSVPKNVRQIIVSVEPRSTLRSGVISFSSNLGDVRMEGPLDAYSQEFLNEGAGSIGLKGWSDNFEQAGMIGFRPMPDGTILYAALWMTSWTQALVPGVIVIDPVDIIVWPELDPMRTANFSFYRGNRVKPWDGPDRYALTQGSVELLEVGNGRMRGTFSGSGYRVLSFRQYDSTAQFTVTNGRFDVPYDADIEYGAATPERMTPAGGTVPLLDRYRDALAVRRQGERLRVGR